ncbi:MAG: isoprenyl transferase [bacterium]|jgi:undecaprenyl diphosphate synthase
MKALLDILAPGDPDRALAESLDPERLPRHIAVIMDGNGRWAGRRNLPRAAGHKAGVEPVRITVETCARLGVQALTLYAFSVENWKRPRVEVDTLWRLLQIYIRKELPNLMQNGIRVRAIGRIEALPEPARKELLAAVEATRGNKGLLVNLAINYGGRTEIIDAANAALAQAQARGANGGVRLTEADIERHLYTAGLPDPDLLIRTSGEMRISNFLLWQVAYSELYVTDTLWPDFRRSDLLQALVDYQRRDRRFGGLSAPRAETEDAAEAELGVPAQ